jgi:hypothetical protein
MRRSEEEGGKDASKLDTRILAVGLVGLGLNCSAFCNTSGDVQAVN